MNKAIFGVFGLLLIVFKVGSAQPISQTGRKPIHCQGSRGLPRIDKVVNGVPSSFIDSVAIKQELESTYHSMAGHWSLFQIQGGWGKPKAPTQQIELVIDIRGQSTIYAAGKTLGVFTIQLKRNWGGYQSPLNPKGQSLFGQYCHYLDIELCRDTLVLNESIGDGMEYVFERSISK